MNTPDPARSCIEQSHEDGVLTIAFNSTNSHNPFSAEMEHAVTAALRAASRDPSVGVVVLTGGEERSFSVGGDFNEVSTFEGGPEVDRWIEDVVEMYVACLEVDKPVLALLNDYVIGIGFQLALCCDCRIGGDEVRFAMPELHHGVACVLGQHMLEVMLGRAAMQKIVIECDFIDADQARSLNLLNATCARPRRHDAPATEVIARLRAYPPVSFRVTKRTMNQGFIDSLRAIVPVAQAAHRESFAARSSHSFMAKILHRHRP